MAADVSWQAAFVALAVLNGAVAIALAIWLPREVRQTARHVVSGDGEARGSVAAHFRNKRLTTTYIVGFSVLFTQVAMFTYVTFYLAAPPFNLSTVALGWLFVTYLLGAVVTPISGHWIDRYGHRTGIGSAMAIGGAGALLTLVPWLPAIVIGLSLAATGVFIAQATASSYIGAVTTQDRGLAVGLYSTFYYAGGSAGSAVPSAVWSLAGWPGCVALVVAVQSAGAAIAFTQWKVPAGAEARRLP